jgi:hypothetical protein
VCVANSDGPLVHDATLGPSDGVRRAQAPVKGRHEICERDEHASSGASAECRRPVVRRKLRVFAKFGRCDRPRHRARLRGFAEEAGAKSEARSELFHGSLCGQLWQRRVLHEPLHARVEPATAADGSAAVQVRCCARDAGPERTSEPAGHGTSPFQRRQRQADGRAGGLRSRRGRSRSRRADVQQAAPVQRGRRARPDAGAEYSGCPASRDPCRPSKSVVPSVVRAVGPLGHVATRSVLAPPESGRP